MKLLTKTIRSYLLYSFVVLLIAVPLFYGVVRHMLLTSVDRSLRSQLSDIRASLFSIRSVEELQTWSKLDKDIQLEPRIDCPADSLYTTYIQKGPHLNDPDPYRELATCIQVQGKNYRLVISSSLIENEDLVGSIVIVEMVLLVLLLGGMIFINQRNSKKLWAPFYASLHTIHQYQLNKQSAVHFNKEDTLEFDDLNRALQNLLKRNQEAYQAQKEFTENAAHEMQTPLAIFQGQLELLMQTSPLTEDQAGIIESMESNNRRISRLSRSLLLLTKLRNDEYHPIEPVPVDEIAQKFAISYKPQIDKKRIKLIQLYPHPLTVPANLALMEILLSNLISNAIRHNVEHGLIEIHSLPDTLIIKNTGSPEPLDPDKMFQRFQKQGSEQEGFGLGLAIISKVCELSGFQIDYRFIDDLHQFRICFNNKPHNHTL